MDGTGSEDESISKQPVIQPMFSIGDIFKSIQQKIRDTKTQNSDACVSGANPAQVSEPCEENSEATSEPCISTSTVNSVTSAEQDDKRSSSEISPVSAPVSVLEPRNDSITAETAVFEECIGGITQRRSSTGSDEQATPKNDAPQEQQNGIIHIKEEKDDTGYTHNHCHQDGNSAGETVVTYPEMREVKIEPFTHEGMEECDDNPGMKEVKMEPFTFEVMKGDDNAELGNDPDVIFHGVSYRDPDDSSTESDSDASLPSFAMEPAPELVEEVVVPRSKGEVMPEELPPLENLHISLPKETKLELLGVVSGIVGVLVIIDSKVDLKQYSPLNDDTVLFLEDRQPFGVVFEVFGPCMAPSYSVRFNNAADIQEKGIEIGLKIYFVPDPVPEVGEITHYVFVQKLKRIKGSDASWKDNNEPPEDRLEFSDDDEEKRFKAKRKADKRNKSTAEPEKRENDEQKGRRGKKHSSSADKGAHCNSALGQANNGGPGRHKHSSGDSHSQPSSSFGLEHRGFRRDFRLSKPVFTAPENQMTRPPQHWTPPGPPSSMGPQGFGPTGGTFENQWNGGPFSGGPAEGCVSGDPVRPPFPDAQGNGPSFGAPLRPAPSPSPGGGGPFGGAPVRPPFPDGPGPFPGEPGTPFTAHSFWRPPNSVSVPVDTSFPPPEFSSFPAGQMNTQQAHPPPPPPPWHPLPPPSFGLRFGAVPPTPPLGSSGAQPYEFGLDPGLVGPPSLGFDAGRQMPARFQGQPQFVQYHPYQDHSWQP